MTDTADVARLLGKAIAKQRHSMLHDIPGLGPSRGITQSQLATYTTLSLATIQALEAGRIGDTIRARTSAAIETALQWDAGTISAVLQGAEPPAAREIILRVDEAAATDEAEASTDAGPGDGGRTQGVALPSAELVYLAVNDRQIGWVDVDRHRADEYARNTGGLLVAVPVIADYRADDATAEQAEGQR